MCYVCSYSECQSFVLSLWKFIKTVAIQKQHTILDSVIEDLAPLPSSVVSFLTESSEVVADERVSVPDTLADKIQVYTSITHRYFTSWKGYIYSSIWILLGIQTLATCSMGV